MLNNGIFILQMMHSDFYRTAIFQPVGRAHWSWSYDVLFCLSCKQYSCLVIVFHKTVAASVKSAKATGRAKYKPARLAWFKFQRQPTDDFALTNW